MANWKMTDKRPITDDEWDRARAEEQNGYGTTFTSRTPMQDPNALVPEHKMDNQVGVNPVAPLEDSKIDYGDLIKRFASGAAKGNEESLKKAGQQPYDSGIRPIKPTQPVDLGQNRIDFNRIRELLNRRSQ